MKKIISVFLSALMLISVCHFNTISFASDSGYTGIWRPVADGCYDKYTDLNWKGKTTSMYTTHNNNATANQRQSFMMYDLSEIRKVTGDDYEISSAKVRLTLNRMNAGYNNHNADTNPDAPGPKVSLYAFEDDSWDEIGLNIPTPLTRKQAEANVVSRNVDNPSLNYAQLPNQATNLTFELDITDYLKNKIEDTADKYMSFEIGYRSEWVKSGTYLLYAREYTNSDYQPQLIIEYNKKEILLKDVKVSPELTTGSGANTISALGVNNLGYEKDITAVLAVYKTDSSGLKTLVDVGIENMTLSEASEFEVEKSFALPNLAEGENFEGKIFAVDSVEGLIPLSEVANTDYTNLCYTNEDFDGYPQESIPESDVITVSGNQRTPFISPSLEKWGNCLRLDAQGGETSALHITPDKVHRNFSVSFDMMLAASDGTRRFIIADDSGNEYTAFDTGDNYIRTCENEVMQYKRAKFYNVCLEFNQRTMTYSLYIDGKKISQNPMPELGMIANMRFEQCSETSASKTFIDNLRIFSGKAPGTTGNFLNSGSDISIAHILDDCVALLNEGKSVIKHGIRQNNENMYAPVAKVIDGVFCARADLIGEALEGDVSFSGNRIEVIVNNIVSQFEIASKIMIQNGNSVEMGGAPAIQNDEMYVPLYEFITGLGLKYYENSYGLVLIGENDYSDRLSSNPTLEKELVDAVCYMRPSRDRILDDYVACESENEHPSLLVNKERIEHLKSAIHTDAELKAIYEKVKKTADSYLDMEPIKYIRSDGRRLDDAQRMYTRYLPPLYMMYNLTGDEKYAEAAWKHLDVLCSDSYPEWGKLSAEHINVAELSSAVVLGYDWLYDWLGEERREQMRNALIEKSVQTGLDFLADSKWWLTSSWNWNVSMASGLSIASLIMMPEEPILCSKLISEYLKSLENSLASFHPEGYWAEGLGYWQYSMTNLCALLSSLENVQKTDYGILATSGLSETAYFPIHCTAPGGIFNFHDTGEDTHSPEQGFFALAYSRPELMAYLGNKVKTATPTSRVLLWYDPEYTDGDYTTMPKDMLYKDVGMMFMRENWSDTAICTGLHAGSNNVGHAHLDSGSFIVDALGERWIADPGRDHSSYNVDSNEKFDIWALRTEAHNCIVINPGEDGGQIVESYSPITESKSGDDSAYAITDLTDAYAAPIQSYKRGLLLTDNRKTVIVRDEIKSDIANDIRWSVTVDSAEITLLPDKRSAVLKKKNKWFYVKIIEGNGEFEVKDANPLPTSPNPEGQISRENFKQLEIWQKGVTDLNLSVAFIPLGENQQIPEYENIVCSLDEWNTRY